MALAVQDAERCAVCRRHFLQGEAIRLFREPSSARLERVCSLCTSDASRRGWNLLEATRQTPLTLHGDPARAAQAVQRDRLVGRLQGQLEGLEAELHETRRSLEDSERRAGDLDRSRRSLTDEVSRLRSADAARAALAAQVDRLEHALSQAQLNERRLERAERRLRELEGELDARHDELERVLRAREREANGAYLRRIAAEAFNRSPHADAVRALARSHGEPRCRLAMNAAGLPRRVRVLFAWPRGWREYGVSVDLVRRWTEVEELGRGEDPGAHAAVSSRANGAWTPSNGLIADP